jgi:hypothetical protein
MAGRITIEEISITGFRAYLANQTIKLRDGKIVRSLAVYAPNAKGKSSLVDAIDFYLSNEGTLARLGLRRSGTHAGPQALEHVKARQKGLPTQVSMAFRDNDGVFKDTRVLPDQGVSPLTEAGQRVCETRKIDFIVRGYELRRFVEERTSQERYRDVSEWFSLSPLLEIQNNLRSLRLKLRRTLDEDAARKERIRDLCVITGQAVTQWEETEVLAWINDHQIGKIEGAAKLPSLDKQAPAYKALKEKKEQEEQQTGLGAVKAAAASVKGLYEKTESEEGAPPEEKGHIVRANEAQKKLEAAIAAEAEERGAAEKAVFKDVWEAAEKLFAQKPDLEQCPVCETAFDDAPAGDRTKVAVNIKTALTGLQAYRDAVAARQDAWQSVDQALANLRHQLSSCVTILGAAGYSGDHATVAAITKFRQEVAAATPAKPLPASSTVEKHLAATLAELRVEEKRLEKAQGEYTYSKVLGRIDNLMELKAKIAAIEKKKAELEGIYERLVGTEGFIAARLRGHLQTVLDQLKDRMIGLYKSIQPDQAEVPAIRLELAEETKQPQLHLLVDFAPNREGVMPSGYLSDSQLHTLALSLRLAGIEMANRDVPIIVLDDVVTSYDADHRKAIAALLAQEFQDTQVIIVTHDEQFFRYLQDHLPEKSWYFKRITALEEEFGPRFHDHKVTAETIQDKWAKGESAANEIRQAEEEWLLAKAREFGVSVRIRDVHYAHKYDRGELARALHSFLKKSGVEMPKVSGISNPFLISLQNGDVENFGSHFSDDPNAWGSIGDEKKRWQEFQEFREHFVCQSCAGSKFKRPKFGMKKAVCNRCETPFGFAKSEGQGQAAG